MAYINKEDLLGTINEVYERKYARCNWKPLYDLYRMCIRRINRAKVVDAVEVVRCKDCIYSFMSITGKTVLYCDMHPSDDHLNLDKNYYCADGERREDNE